MFCWKHYKIVFSGKHSFSKTQLVKPTFSTMSKNTFFKEKVSFLVLGNFRWNPDFYRFSWFTLFWSKKILTKTGSCNENARFFSLPDTNSVKQFLLKIYFFWFFTFLDDHLKKTLFFRFFCYFPFFFFSFFCSYFSNIKKNKKCNFFSKTSFLITPNFAKTLFWHTMTLFVFQKNQKTL